MNKKRLAALALSAVMAAGTVSVPVSAADFSDGADVVTQEAAPQAETFSAEAETPAAEVTEEAADSAGDQWSPGYTVMPETITFHFDENNLESCLVTFVREATDGSGKTYDDSVTGTVAKRLAANCDHPGLIWMVATIDGKEYYSGNTTVNSEAFVIESEPQREHEMVEVKRQTIQEATHYQSGTLRVWYECAYDDCDYTDVKDEKISQQTHTWGEWVYEPGYNVKADENGHVIFDENGDPELINELKDGIYYKTRYCTEDGAEDRVHKETLRAYAKKAAYAKIIDKEGIVNDIVGQEYDYPTADLPIDEATIELEDCSEEGYYVVEYYTVQHRPISQEKIIVKPHHFNTFATAEFKTADDQAQCKVEYDENGNLKVTNTSCYLPIEYTEVTHCSAAGCTEEKHDAKFESPECANNAVIKTETKTAEPTGNHAIKTEAKAQINRLVKRGNVLYTELQAIADKESNYVQISERPENNCEEDGKVTVSYICIVDGKTVVEQQTVDVVASGHDPELPVRDEETYVAPTCLTTGSYDAVTICKTCGKELERREDIVIPRIKHTNEVNVAANGIGKDDVYADATAYIKFVGDKVVDNDGENLANLGKTFNVNSIGEYGKDEYTMYAYVYTNCTVCGEHEVKLADSRQDLVEITITDIKKQEESGKAGYITLKATYDQNDVVGGTVTEEITVPYFSTIEAYNGRLEETPETPLNGLHWDEDGECRYYVDGVFQEDFSGILEYAGKSFVLNNGVLCKDASGLNLIDDQWYYLTEGRVRTDVTQVVMYDGEWFYVTNGKLDTSVNDLVLYDGETFVFVEGRLAQEGNGLWVGQEGVWYFLSDGRVAREHTGVAMYDNEWFYVVNGKLAADYNGTVEYNGGTFRVDHGMLREQVK